MMTVTMAQVPGLAHHPQPQLTPLVALAPHTQRQVVLALHLVLSVVLVEVAHEVVEPHPALVSQAVLAPAPDQVPPVEPDAPKKVLSLALKNTPRGLRIKKMKPKHYILLLLTFLLLTACSTQGAEDAVREDWPEYPPIEYSWVVDKNCNFSQESIDYADAIFQKLQDENLIEVGVVCISGVGDDIKWLMGWGDYVGVGLKDSGRGIIWLIRPDVDPKDHRITYHTNDQSWQTTAVDNSPIMRQTVNFCNWDNFDGCLENLAQMTDNYIRQEDRLD